MHTPFDIIAFDADDTLWHNEQNFKGAQSEFRGLLREYHSEAWIDERLNAVEVRNLAHFGYGIKGFTLSMIETAIELTEGRISGAKIQQIVDLGRAMINAPIDLVDGVHEVLTEIALNYPIGIITKGDLLDQEFKVARSGLGELFAFVEIVSEKNPQTYRSVMARRSVKPERFLMVGNSLRSDILPVLEAGGSAVYVPHPLTWSHEMNTEDRSLPPSLTTLENLRLLPQWLRGQ